MSKRAPFNPPPIPERRTPIGGLMGGELPPVADFPPDSSLELAHTPAAPARRSPSSRPRRRSVVPQAPAVQPHHDDELRVTRSYRLAASDIRLLEEELMRRRWEGPSRRRVDLSQLLREAIRAYLPRDASARDAPDAATDEPLVNRTYRVCMSDIRLLDEELMRRRWARPAGHLVVAVSELVREALRSRFTSA